MKLTEKPTLRDTQRGATIADIQETLETLNHLARAENLDFLSYLIGMALLECQESECSPGRWSKRLVN